MVGGYAEYVAVEEDNIALVPAVVTDEQAAIAACSIGTVLNGIRDVGHVSIGDRCSSQVPVVGWACTRFSSRGSRELM
jgi:NADPH:quinone reductase-like Zn-dependent oxidoreductase